jgi:hypothetical protein
MNRSWANRAGPDPRVGTFLENFVHLVSRAILWLPSDSPMPSLIYITRIQSPSAELTQALESSGVHVRSFAPGEITADECVVVMTSDAVPAGARQSGLRPRGMPPLDAIPKHLGADAAIWNYIKTGKVSESFTVEAKAVFGQQPSVSTTIPVPHSLGFVASQAGVRALAASQLLPAPVKKLPEANNGGRASRPSGRVGAPGLPTLKIPAEELPSKSLWQPVAVVAILSVFAVMLLTGRDPILPAWGVAAVDSRNPGARPVPSPVDVDHRASTLTSPTKPSNPVSEARPHISDYDFVAEDHTTHFDQHSRPAATTPAPDLRRATPNRPVRKRVVIN